MQLGKPFTFNGPHHLRIFDAAFDDVRATVAANRNEVLADVAKRVMNKQLLDFERSDFPVREILATMLNAYFVSELALVPEGARFSDLEVTRQDELEFEKAVKLYNAALQRSDDRRATLDRKTRSTFDKLSESTAGAIFVLVLKLFMWALYIPYWIVRKIVDMRANKDDAIRTYEKYFLDYLAGTSRNAREYMLDYARRFGGQDEALLAVSEEIRHVFMLAELQRFNRGIVPKTIPPPSLIVAPDRAKPVESTLQGAEESTPSAQPLMEGAPGAKPHPQVPAPQARNLIVPVVLLLLVAVAAFLFVTRLRQRQATSTPAAVMVPNAEPIVTPAVSDARIEQIAERGAAANAKETLEAITILEARLAHDPRAEGADRVYLTLGRLKDRYVERASLEELAVHAKARPDQFEFNESGGTHVYNGWHYQSLLSLFPSSALRAEAAWEMTQQLRTGGEPGGTGTGVIEEELASAERFVSLFPDSYRGADLVSRAGRSIGQLLESAANSSEDVEEYDPAVLRSQLTRLEAIASPLPGGAGVETLRVIARAWARLGDAGTANRINAAIGDPLVQDVAATATEATSTEEIPRTSPAAAGSTPGPVPAPASAQVVTMSPPQTGLDYPGNDLRSQYPSNVSECSRLCAEDARCVAYTLFSGACWMKSAATNQRSCSLCTSGVKVSR